MWFVVRHISYSVLLLFLNTLLVTQSKTIIQFVVNRKAMSKYNSHLLHVHTNDLFGIV